jgi:large subunit ribosomal protein L3
MSGHMGDVKKTVQNLKITSIDQEKNLLLIKGPIPGSTGSNIILKPAIK